MHTENFSPFVGAQPENAFEDRFLEFERAIMARPGIDPHFTDISGLRKQLLEQPNLRSSLRDELGVQAEPDLHELTNVGKFTIS